MSKLTAYDKFLQQALKYGFSLFGTAKTGQIISYENDDDGAFEKGYPRIGPRFVDNGDGTVTDNATGLMWVKDPEEDPGEPFDSSMVWTTAIEASAALNFAGHTDWRLPNIKELLSIADFGAQVPTIDSVFFPNTENEYYWSSTTYLGLTTKAFAVYFRDGDIYYVVKDSNYFTRPVRLGYPK